jgi:hypothetical protein
MSVRTALIIIAVFGAVAIGGTFAVLTLTKASAHSDSSRICWSGPVATAQEGHAFCESVWDDPRRGACVTLNGRTRCMPFRQFGEILEKLGFSPPTP